MIDNPPPPQDAAQGALGQLNHLGTWIIIVTLSITGGAIATIKRAGSMMVAAYYIMLSSFIGPGGAIIAISFFGANIFVAGFVGWLCGMMVFGIAALLKLTDKRIESIDLISQVLPKTAIVSPEKMPPTTEKESEHEH